MDPRCSPLSSTAVPMEPFLDRLASALLEKHQHELDQVAVVLPGQRAGVHLRRSLAKCAGRTIWSPEMLNMGSFIQRMSGLHQGEGMEMLFMLYEAHQQTAGTHADPLPEFLQWAPITLRDMSEVDSHLLDLGDLYRDLRSFHEIDAWSFNLSDLSTGQKKLAAQWASTGAMHRRMHELMDERGIGTSGWLARRTAERAAGSIGKLPWKKVWIAGLNALDPASTRILKLLQDQDKAIMAWDIDRSYMDDHAQEAGKYLRRSIKDLGSGVLPAVNEIQERKRQFHVVAVPHGVAQARYAAQMLAELPENERAGTAIVLAAENLLMPLLEALPPDAGPFNVTMGMPLISLPVHGLIEAFLELHASNTSDAGFYHTNVERLLLHPFVHGDVSIAVLEKMRSAQLSRCTGEAICAMARESGSTVPAMMEAALRPVNNDVIQLQERILALIAWARGNCSTDRFAVEQLYRMARVQQRLDKGLERTGIPLPDIRSYITLRARLLREENIGFYGEPLSGAQIMGFLETRALDHERVIVLGANDGTLPPTGSGQSWIPFEIRRAYNLPLKGDGEAITAYHFQRLMHLASEVHLIHDTSGENGSSGPSRYVEQWRHEVIGNSNTQLHRHSISVPFPVRHGPRIVVQKDEHVLARLKKMGERGFSPSALATWLTCPLDLYFKYILGVRSPEEVDEKLGGDVLGEAVHRVMELLFQPFVGRPIDAKELLASSASIEPLLIEHLSQTFPIASLRSGHFRLRIEMATKALDAYLTAEANRCGSNTTIPLHLEAEVSAVLPNAVVIRGRCDRIDERDGIPHILDVKTGSVKPDQVEFKGLTRDQIKPEKRFGLQLLMYSWAYMMQHPEVDRVRAGIIPLQKASQAAGVLLKISGEADLTRYMLPEITALLSGLIDELMDPAVPFSHLEDSLYCGCCVG